MWQLAKRQPGESACMSDGLAQEWLAAGQVVLGVEEEEGEIEDGG